MKFYYNGKLIRTSQNHHYTHAVVTTSGECVGCRTSEAAAQYIIDYEVNQSKQEIENCKAAIKALESGKSYYMSRYGRKSMPVMFRKDSTVKAFERYIEVAQNRIDLIRNVWKVVELEER